MSDEHKAALAQGRSEGKTVRAYLDALRNNKPKRGRRRTTDSIQTRLAAIEAQLREADPVSELHLVQERRDLLTELTQLDLGIDLSELEDAFVSVAKTYSERQGISYGSWREIGVPASVLAAAGLPRTRS